MADIESGGKLNFLDVYGYKAASGGNPTFDLIADVSGPVASVTLDRRGPDLYLARGSNNSVEAYLVARIEHGAQDLKGILTGFRSKYVELFRRDLRTIGYTETQLSSVEGVLTLIEDQFETGAFSSKASPLSPQFNIHRNFGEYMSILNKVDSELAISDPTLAMYVNHPSFGTSEKFNERPNTKLTRNRVASAGRILARKIVELDILEMQGLPRIVRTNLVVGVLSILIVGGDNFLVKVPPFRQVFQQNNLTETSLIAKALSDFDKQLAKSPGLTNLSKTLANLGFTPEKQLAAVTEAGGNTDVLRYTLTAPIYNMFRSTNNRIGMSVRPSDSIETTNAKIQTYINNPNNKPEFLTYFELSNTGGIDGLKPYNFRDLNALTVTLPDDPSLISKLVLKQYGLAIKGEKEVLAKSNTEGISETKAAAQYASLVKAMYESDAYRNVIERSLNVYFGLETERLVNGQPEYNVVATNADRARRDRVYKEVEKIIKLTSVEDLGRIMLELAQ